MLMEWQIAPLSEWQADAVFFFFFEDPAHPLPGYESWIRERITWGSDSCTLKDFTGKNQQIGIYYNSTDEKIPRLISIGLGPQEKFELEKLRNGAASAFRKCRELGIKQPALPMSAFEGLPLDMSTALREALIGGISGLYKYAGLKTRDKEPLDNPEKILLLSDSQPDSSLGSIPAAVGSLTSGIFLARDLVSSPSNQVTPAYMVDVSTRLSQSHGFKLQILDIEATEALGMGCFAAVARGSREPAYVVVLEHAPPGSENEKPLVFVGKGITFDTGGISLKPSNKMDAMKQDMAGAAAVLGLFEFLANSNISRRVVGILPCTENMPDGKAYKPGDVVHSLSGLTVEVISTDAEGRMVLCDAITFAQRYQPALIIDIATLTGACIIALGDSAAAVMGNNDRLINQIQEIGEKVGERFWPFPLWDLYFDYIKSDVADFKNVGERKAGTIVGGIFLKQFVPDAIPWTHLDIAGTAWTSKDLGWIPQGATGFGVRVLAEIVQLWTG